MIERIIDWSANNRLLIGLIFLLLAGAGIWAVVTTPVDAIPDLSDNQVIVFTEWMGRSPEIVEDQVTYPLTTALQGLPDIKGVRAQTMFGMSFIFVIFEDGVDLYFARQQVAERIATAAADLPAGVVPTMGPDGTGVGHIYWYTVEGEGYDPAALRSIQDWFIRYKLAAVDGVAEVASIGGFVRQYQVDVDPAMLRSFDLTFSDVVRAIRRANNEVGGKLIENNDAEFFVRGQGYFNDREDIEQTLVAAKPGGLPITVDMVADVQLGGDIRRGSLEKNGRGEVVGGIVVMRQNENAREVIERVKEKIAEIDPGLPPGVEIVPSYDRSPLIDKAVATLRNGLIEEALIVTLVVLIFIFHVRSALRILIEIPVSVLMAFLLMRAFDITSNIMSLGGIALAIGVVVDSSIVLVENAYRNLAEALGTSPPGRGGLTRSEAEGKVGVGEDGSAGGTGIDRPDKNPPDVSDGHTLPGAEGTLPEASGGHTPPPSGASLSRGGSFERGEEGRSSEASGGHTPPPSGAPLSRGGSFERGEEGRSSEASGGHTPPPSGASLSRGGSFERGEEGRSSEASGGHTPPPSGAPLSRGEYFRVAVLSAKQVGRAIFFSEAIMVISFLPVFLLEGQEGKLFHPLAWTKTFVIASSAIVAITLVPVLMTLLMRGKFRTERENPVMRFFHALYRPVLRWSLKWRKTTIALNLLALAVTIPLLMTRGTEFMPPLDEGSLLFMPVLLPDASIGEVNRVMQIQDRIIADYPEVDHVLGKAGRAETATDNAPLSMIETIVLLKPRSEWRPGITKQKIIADLDAQLQIPGVRNGWTQPIINRINMLATGVRTDLGLKIFGPDLDTLEHYGIMAEEILKKVPGAADVAAERVQGGVFLDIDLDEGAAARYGVQLADVQTLIETAIGGENLGLVLDGRARYPVRVRYQRELRDNIEAIKEVLVPIVSGTSSGMEEGGMSAERVPAMEGNRGGMSGMGTSGSAGRAPVASSGSSMSDLTTNFNLAGSTGRSLRGYVRLGDIAEVKFSPGPSMIPSENGELKSTVFLNVRGRDMGSFVAEAKERLAEELVLPRGYTVAWSGQYENQQRAQSRLLLVVPVVFVVIFFMLFLTLKDWKEASIVMLSVPFALIGGVWLISALGYNLSVAVWVGFIALYGVAVQTGVVMVVYLHHALDRRIGRGGQEGITEGDIHDATVEGALGRLRPKLMTVATSMLGLVPIMFSTGVGSDVMKPLVAPMIGGLLTSAVHVLIMTPVLFIIMKERALKKGELKESRMAEWMG